MDSLAIEHLAASLQFWRDNQLAQPDGVWERLVIAPGDSIRVQTEPIPRIDIIATGLSVFELDEEPSAQFTDDLRSRLIRTGNWLSRQSPEVFADARGAGCDVRLVIVLWATDSHFELNVPTSLLRACGELEIGLTVTGSD